MFNIFETHLIIIFSCLFQAASQYHQRYDVVFMELCNAGSLYEVIESPENCHGLDEPQFKSVLSDVGMCKQCIDLMNNTGIV